jgi:hypothetical protein
MQARLLDILRDGYVWSRSDLSERVAAEELAPAPAEAVPEALDALIEAGLANRLSEDAVVVTWRGRAGAASDAPDGAGALQVAEDASGAGVVEAVESADRFRGGAEGLSGKLEPISAGE